MALSSLIRTLKTIAFSEPAVNRSRAIFRFLTVTGLLCLLISRAPAQHAHHEPATAKTTQLPTEYDGRVVADLVAAAQQQGDAHRGAQVFRAAKFACISCHHVGPH